MTQRIRAFIARYSGWCGICHKAIEQGDSVCYDEDRNIVHARCSEDE